jgi:hypothetical protein
MTVNLRRHIGATALAVIALPSIALAQRGRGPRADAPGPNPVAPLIDMRRQLDLSSRQLTALDSIERSLLQRNRDVMRRLDARRDTSLARRNLRDLTQEERTQLRNQMQARRDSLQPLFAELRRNDSTARAAGLRVLSDSQRARVREFEAERRGLARGMGMRGMQGRRMGPRGQMGGRGSGPRGVRPPRDEFAPRRGQFGPRGGPGPRGRFGPNGDMELRPRFRQGPDDMMPRRPVPPELRMRMRDRLGVPLRRLPPPQVEPDTTRT